MGHLARAVAAEKLRTSDAVSAHKQKPDEFRRWQTDQQALAGL